MGRMLRIDRSLFVPLILAAMILACNLPVPTSSPVPPQQTEPPVMVDTATPTLAPPMDTATPSPWERVSGTWSGCHPSGAATNPTILSACVDPIGPFVTLYLLPACSVGEHCGNFVKAAFESEFILLKLTLVEIQGATIKMYADAGSGMFASHSTDVEIERVGADVRITEATGASFILPPGCDPVIDLQTTIGCFEHVP